MPSFFQNIWTLVFPPGTNGTLIIATHVSFAILQTTFLSILNNQRSWYFLSLNLVCGGLWAGITWFIGAAAEMDRLEQEAERLRKLRIERDQKLNEDESAWFAKEVEEMRRVELEQKSENEGDDIVEEKKER